MPNYRFASEKISLLNKTAKHTSTVTIEKIEHSGCTNLDELIKLTHGNSDAMIEMILLYLEQTKRLVPLMLFKTEKGDWTALKSVMHKMIPSFSIVGISSDFENITKQIINYCDNSNKIALIPAMVDKIRLVSTKACIELEINLKRIKNSLL